MAAALFPPFCDMEGGLLPCRCIPSLCPRFDSDQNGTLDRTEVLRHLFPDEYVRAAWLHASAKFARFFEQG